MRNGEVTNNHVDLLLSRRLDKISRNEIQSFNNPLNTMHTCKQIIPITFDYLGSLKTPIDKVAINYSTTKITEKNPCMKECSYLSLSGLGIGSLLMLMKNYVV